MAGLNGLLLRCAGRLSTWLAGLVACAMLMPSAPALAQRYNLEILELPPRYDTIGWARGINNAGDVVGWVSEVNTFNYMPGLWRNGRFVELPLLDNGGGNFHFAGAEGINDRGQVVGFSNGPIWGEYPVFWPDDQTIVNLIDRDGTAQEINDLGVIVGDYAVQAFSYKPFIWWGEGRWESLWPPFDVAPGINNLNEVVGHDGRNAIYWRDGVASYLPCLRTAVTCGASTINDLGEIVGTSRSDTGVFLPVIWQDRIVEELPRVIVYPNGFAAPTSINMNGEIVGTNQVAFQTTHPVLWRNNLVVDLNDMTTEPHPEWEFHFSPFINDLGQIAIRATDVVTLKGYAAILHPVDTGLTVWGIDPARPGRRNTIQVNHATPGGRVSLLWGTARGEPQALPQCPGAMIDITDPRLAGTAVAGQDGRAFIRINIPAQTEGNFIVQVVDHRSCEVSPPAWTLIKAEN